MHLDTLLLFSGGKADPNADSKTVCRGCKMELRKNVSKEDLPITIGSHEIDNNK